MFGVLTSTATFGSRRVKIPLSDLFGELLWRQARRLHVPDERQEKLTVQAHDEIPLIVVRMIVEPDIQGVPGLHDIFTIVTLGRQGGERDEGDCAFPGGTSHHDRRQHKDQPEVIRYPINLSHRFNPYYYLTILIPVLNGITGGVSGVADGRGKFNDSSIVDTNDLR